MAESRPSRTELILIFVIFIVIIILIFLLLTRKTTSIVSPTPTPPPISSPTPSPTPSPSQPITVTSFVIPSGCTDGYCWGMITFNSGITGTLTQVNTVYSNGSTYSWNGSYTVTQGTNTIWLDDCLPCNHLSCNPPGQITSLVFVINGTQYTVSVTPTTGNPLATVPSSNSQKFIGGAC